VAAVAHDPGSEVPCCSWSPAIKCPRRRRPTPPKASPKEMVVMTNSNETTRRKPGLKLLAHS
jgi:hypothetical protein